MTDVARVNMQWDPGLKERVQALVGKRGLTPFVVEAVEAKLAGHATAKDLERELNETRDLAQALADALVRSGDYDDARARVMEISLPAWLETTGWPQEFVDLVPVEDVEPEVILQGAYEPHVAASAPTHGFTEEDLHKPSYAVAAEVAERVAWEPVDPPVSIGPGETVTITPPPVVVTEGSGSSLMDRVRAKAAEKGLDMDGLDLKPASTLPQPEPREQDPDPGPISQVERLEVPGGPGNPHNHVFERVDGILCCNCGGWIDESTTPGKFIPAVDEELMKTYGGEEVTVSLQTSEGVDAPAYPRQEVTWTAASGVTWTAASGGVANAEPVTDASAPEIETCPHGVPLGDDCWDCF